MSKINTGTKIEFLKSLIVSKIIYPIIKEVNFSWTIFQVQILIYGDIKCRESFFQLQVPHTSNPVLLEFKLVTQKIYKKKL